MVMDDSVVGHGCLALMLHVVSKGCAMPLAWRVRHSPKGHCAACLAYIWIVYLGSLGEKDGWREIMHRRKRCDLSLFQLGLRVLEHFFNEELPIPV